MLERLRTEYGFCHGDAYGRNGIFIKENQGGERLVSMDLEEYKLVGNGKRSIVQNTTDDELSQL
jgi:hypothetical protein